MSTPKSQMPLKRKDKIIVPALPVATSRPRPPKDRMEGPAQKPAKKNKNINLRISEADLEAIKRIAIREGLPYQTLIGSLIHKYAVERTKDIH